MTQLSVTVLYFAWVREAAGCDEEKLVLEMPLATASDILSAVLERHPKLKLRADKLNIAINQDHASLNDPVKSGDEIALFPPVTGG